MADLKQQLEAAQADLKIANEKVATLEKEASDLKAVCEKKVADSAKEVADLKAEVSRLLTTSDKDEKKTGVGESFEHGGKKYELMISACSIPGIGRLTALEILTNEAAKAWLVSNKSGAIKEIY